MNKVQTKKSSKALHTRPNTLESGSFLPKITNSPRLNGQKESLVSEAVEVEDYDYNIAHFCVPRMFCITEVLHSLALDSFQVRLISDLILTQLFINLIVCVVGFAKVREVLGKDVKAMWTSINSVFSALCDAKDLSKANSLLSPPPSMSAKGSFKLRETRQNSALLPPISSTYASDVLNNSTEFMRSSYSSIKNSLVTDSMSHFGRESRHIDPSKILSKPQHFRSIEERNQMFPHVPFPKHGFNKYEWTLIMEARNNVLKTMQLVGVRLFNQSNNQNFEVLQTASTDDQENGEEEDVLVLDSPRQLALPQNAPSEDKTTKSQDRLDNNIENSTPRDDVNATVNNVNL